MKTPIFAKALMVGSSVVLSFASAAAFAGEPASARPEVNTAVFTAAGASTFLEKYGPMNTMLDDKPGASSGGVYGTVSGGFHSLRLNDGSVVLADGTSSVGVGMYDYRPDVRLTSNLNVLAGPRKGAFFIAGGAKLSLEGSPVQKNTNYAEKSIAVPVFAGVTFEGEKAMRVLIGPVLQYRLGKHPNYGSVNALETGGRMIFSDAGSRAFVMGEILLNVAGKEYTGNAIQCNLAGRVNAGPVFVGLDASVITMSDRPNKDGTMPVEIKSTEVSEARVSAVLGGTW